MGFSTKYLIISFKNVICLRIIVSSYSKQLLFNVEYEVFILFSMI